MSHVTVEKIDNKQIEKASVLDEAKTLTDRIRRHAFELFEGRNSVDGFAMEDWLNAERDLLFTSESELVEQEGKFEVRMNAPGFDAGDVKVTALPDALIIRAESAHTHDEKDGDVRFCEFGRKSLYRRFDLPETIDVDQVTAELNKGVLHLTACKATAEAAPKPAAVSATKPVAA